MMNVGCGWALDSPQQISIHRASFCGFVAAAGVNMGRRWCITLKLRCIPMQIGRGFEKGSRPKGQSGMITL